MRAIFSVLVNLPIFLKKYLFSHNKKSIYGIKVIKLNFFYMIEARTYLRGGEPRVAINMKIVGPGMEEHIL